MKKIFLFTVSLFAFQFVFSQTLSLKQANKFFENLAYSKAIPYYEKVLIYDSLHVEANLKIAESYRLTSDECKAIKHYSRIENNPEFKSEFRINYAKCLLLCGKLNEAKKVLGEYNLQVPDDERSKALISGIEKLPEVLRDSAYFPVQNMTGINTSGSEFGVAIYKNGLMYSSNRLYIDALQNNHSWTGKDFYHILFSDNKGSAKTISFSSAVQTKFNDGPVSYDTNEQKLYVTRNQTENKKALKSADKQVKLYICSFNYSEEKKKWINEEKFAFNNKDYNVAHPAISSDGSMLIFSSDMPGGLGGMDLYSCKKEGNSWGKPENLGPAVNTKGNEIFPYISTTGILFFSSNGREGIGGLDVYYSFLKEGKPTKIKHMSYPVNTHFDDFGIVLEADEKAGYLVSNRAGGKGDDDIYKVEIKKPFVTYLKGIITDELSKKALDSAVVVLKNDKGEILAETKPAADGAYSFPVEAGQKYSLEGSRNRYIENKTNTEIPDDGKTIEVIADLTLIENKGFWLTGLVYDHKTQTPLVGVKITVWPAEKPSSQNEYISDAKGTFTKTLENVKYKDEIHFKIKLEKNGYMAKTVDYNRILDKVGEYKLHEEIDLSFDKLVVGMDIAKVINLKPIYFDMGKSDIRLDAAAELDKIVTVMNENPNMTIELGSHTDCRSSEKFNKDLSEKRAKSSAAYIVKQGINKKRITGKGYGESKLINDCACEGKKKSDCDEERHQQNRRTEFIIFKM